MALTPQIDNQMNNNTNTEQIPSKTYGLSNDLVTSLVEGETKDSQEYTEEEPVIEDKDIIETFQLRGNAKVNTPEEGEEVEGTDIEITDYDIDKESGFSKFKGNTFQQTFDGNQLVDFNAMTPNAGIDSYTFSSNTLVVSNLTGANYPQISQDVADFLKANAGQTINFSCENYNKSDNSANDVVRIQYTLLDDATTRYLVLRNNSGTITPQEIPENINTALFCIRPENRGSSTSVANTLTIFKPLLYIGTSEKDYEPYVRRTSKPKSKLSSNSTRC